MIGAMIKASIPVTWNPGTTTDANQKHKPLTIKAKNPRLKTVMGRETKLNAGLIEPFTTPITAAATKAAGKLARLTPEKRISTTNKLRAVPSIVKAYCTILAPNILVKQQFVYSFEI